MGTVARYARPRPGVRRRRAARRDQAGPGARAGGQRRHPARHLDAAWPCPTSTGATAFPIGGVAATDPDDGVISPGGVGYDINCGVRLLALQLGYDELLGAGASAGARALRATSRPASGGRGVRECLAAREARRVLIEGPRCAGRGPRLRRRARRSSSPRRAAGSTAPTRPGLGDRATRARRRPVRHARLGQPLPRGAGRRRRSTTPRRPRRSACGEGR